jgi:hypothetical protein
MPLHAITRARLEEWFGEHNWNEGEAEWRGTIRLLADLYRDAWLDGYPIHTAEIRDWACGRGWSDRDAEELADVADIVHIALLRTGVIGG